MPCPNCTICVIFKTIKCYINFEASFLLQRLSTRTSFFFIFHPHRVCVLYSQKREPSLFGFVVTAFMMPVLGFSAASSPPKKVLAAEAVSKNSRRKPRRWCPGRSCPSGIDQNVTQLNKCVGGGVIPGSSAVRLPGAGFSTELRFSSEAWNQGRQMSTGLARRRRRPAMRRPISPERRSWGRGATSGPQWRGSSAETAPERNTPVSSRAVGVFCLAVLRFRV